MKRVFYTSIRTLAVTASVLFALSSAAWGIGIQVSPSSQETGKPITFTVVSCSNCSDFVWEFKNIDNPSVVDGGDGYTLTKSFDVAGTYRVMVSGQQYMSDIGGYVFVSLNKTFTVTIAPFTVILTPNSKWTVRGTIGQDDGIACTIDAKDSLCEETYAPHQHLHLKVILNGDEDMLGWKVDDEIMSDNDLLKMLIPE